MYLIVLVSVANRSSVLCSLDFSHVLATWGFLHLSDHRLLFSASSNGFVRFQWSVHDLILESAHLTLVALPNSRHLLSWPSL